MFKHSAAFYSQNTEQWKQCDVIQVTACCRHHDSTEKHLSASSQSKARGESSKQINRQDKQGQRPSLGRHIDPTLSKIIDELIDFRLRFENRLQTTPDNDRSIVAVIQSHHVWLNTKCLIFRSTSPLGLCYAKYLRSQRNKGDHKNDRRERADLL